MDVEGDKGLLVTGQSRRTWSAATISLRLATLNGSGAIFGLKNAQFGEGTSQPAPPPPRRPKAPPVSFWLKTWIWQGHYLGCRMVRLGMDPRR